MAKFSFPHDIDSKEKLEEYAIYYGILPFFPNPINGLSVEEMAAPGMLFGGNSYEGCWEWKGPVIRKRTTAYGKFFRKKAGFVSLELLPDFLNYRRFVNPVKEGSMDEMLLDIIRENDSLTSTELRQLIFGGRKRTDWRDLPEFSLIPNEDSGKRKSLEGPLQRLQMGGRIIISDFEYKKTKSGERYGWGVARYSTPELIFPDLVDKTDHHSPEESLETLITFIRSRSPFASRNKILELIK